jgi:hypothetical protein
MVLSKLLPREFINRYAYWLRIFELTSLVEVRAPLAVELGVPFVLARSPSTTVSVSVGKLDPEG